jgi:hypothetical protein
MGVHLMAEPSEKEISDKRDAALRRALTTPPKPKQDSVKRKKDEKQAKARDKH